MTTKKMQALFLGALTTALLLGLTVPGAHADKPPTYHPKDVAAMQAILDAHPSVLALPDVERDDPDTWYFTGWTLSDSGDSVLTGLDLSNQALSGTLDLNGLENLDWLDCSNNQFQELNIDQLKKLTMLDCSDNQLQTLNLNQLKELVWLVCSDNQLQTLHIDQLKELLWLDCPGNQIKTLDVGQLIQLETLDCSDNQLQTLHVAQLKQLEELDCSNNQIQALDLTQLTNLTRLYCSDNQIKTLDPTRLKQLNQLDCHNNQIQTLNTTGLYELNGLACGREKEVTLTLPQGKTLQIGPVSPNSKSFIYLSDFQEKSITISMFTPLGEPNLFLRWKLGGISLKDPSIDRVTCWLGTLTSIQAISRKSEFEDITTHWARIPIAYAINQSLMKGTSDTTFGPDETMTRGMFVTVLYRLTYFKEVIDGLSFDDVPPDAYYAPAVIWAVQNDIAHGVGDGLFAPDRPITRQEMAAMFVGYIKTGYEELPVIQDEIFFADRAHIAAWAKDAVRQMQMAGLLSGKSGNRFDPEGRATRAEVAVILLRFDML